MDRTVLIEAGRIPKLLPLRQDMSCSRADTTGMHRALHCRG